MSMMYRLSLVLLLAGCPEIPEPAPLQTSDARSALEACESERLMAIDRAETIWELVETERRFGECRMLAIESGCVGDCDYSECVGQCENLAYLCATYRSTELARAAINPQQIRTSDCWTSRVACRDECSLELSD